MGSWGTAISSNDTYADIYGEFFDLYNDGLSVDEVSKKLISENEDMINDPEDANNFWFALAKAQWECKQPDKDIFEKVRQIIETGQDLEVWRELEADEKDIEKRKLVLDKFLADLQTERPKAKARKKKIIRQPVFEKGDCLTFKLEDGNYSGAVVLEAVRDTEYAHNLIASTRINQPNKPVKKDFENAEVLILNYTNYDNTPNVLWYLPFKYKEIAHLIEKIGNIEVRLNYDRNATIFGGVGDFVIWFINVANKQFQSEQTKPKPAIKQTIKELTGNKGKWKFW